MEIFFKTKLKVITQLSIAFIFLTLQTYSRRKPTSQLSLKMKMVVKGY